MMKIKWEEKRTYEEEIEIEDIMEYIEDNDYYVSTLMFARTIVKEWLGHFGDYSLDKYPESIIERIAEMLLKTIEEQKITLEDIENKIHEFKSFIVRNLLSSTYDTLIDEKIQDLLDTIERYKNGE